MADPVTLGAIGIGTTLAGGALSAFGAEKSGAATQQMYQYQAAVAQINKNIDLQNSEYAIEQGEEQAGIEGRKGAQQFGAIRATEGASNIDVNSGSAALVQSSQRAITATDMSQIRANAAKTAYDFQVRATSDSNQATLDQIAGANAKTAGDITAAASILGTVGSVSSKWLSGSQSGMFGSSLGGGPIKLYGPDQTITGYA